MVAMHKGGLRNILILDTETTGTDPDAVCIEVACVLYSVTYATPVRVFSSLLRAEGNAAEAVNGIPPAMLTDAPTADRVWPAVAKFAGQADAIVAHGAEFDSRFVPIDACAGRPWICSCQDIAWPRQMRQGESLVKLALAHGLGVATAHRALADCDLLARLLSRVAELGTDLVPLLERGLRPKATFVALVPFERKDEARDAGFRWEGETKRWLRTMAVEDAALLPFPTRNVVDERADTVPPVGEAAA
jgi:DNA polymerase-3 subunit epsilon